MTRAAPSLLAVAALVASACATAPPRRYPGTLRPPAELGADFVARQHLTAKMDGDEAALDFVLQKRGDTLTLLGLTPWGARGFVLEQTGAAVRYEAFVDREMPFPPEYILYDVHRTLVPPGPPPPDGERVAERAGERVVEVWSGGRLQSRRFTRLDGDPPGEIRVDYEGGAAPGEVPRRVRFDNGWFGYALDVETVEVQPLP